MNPIRYLALALTIALAGVILEANAHNPSGGHTTTTAVSCTPNPVVINTATTCTATVTDVIGNGQDAVPSGTVTFTSSGAGSFSATTCTLAPVAGFSARCAVTYTPTATGTQTITASYPLTNAPSHRFAASSGATALTVRLTGPGVAKAFSPTSIGTSATSTLTITLTNPNAAAITGAAFTDTYPANLVNAATPAGSTNCTGGTVTAAASGGSVALSGATIPASGSCTVTVSVTSSIAGSYVNTIAAGAVTSTNAGPNTAAASATLTVLTRPVVAKAFNPTSIGTGATSTLTITLSNTNSTAITGAAFSDTYPTNVVNASTPAGSTTCGGTVTAAATGDSVALSGATIPASGSCTVTVSVTSSIAGSYLNTIAAGAVSSTNAGANTVAASATLTVTISVASFDAVEEGGAPGSRLYTKLSGVNFTLDILALDSSSLVSTGYSGTVSLELVDASSGGGVCASMTALQALGSLTFAGVDAGRKSTAFINYAGAARNAKIRIADAIRGITSCSFDAFAIRPATLSVASNMTNAASSGTPILAAGGNFTLTATALAGYNGTPAIDNTKIAAHGGAIQTGSLSGVFSAAAPATGAASGSTFTYSEVGNFQFLAQGIYDDAFTALEQPGDCTNDFSNVLVGGRYGCKFGTTAATALFGRFTPFDLAVTRNTPLFAPACSSNFTYIGQPFNYASAPVITVTARNSAGITTRNYVGAYMKIANSSVTPNNTTARYTRFDALGAGTTPALDVGALPLAAVDPVIGTFTDGVGTLTFSGGATGAVFTRTQPVLPFNADIALSVSVADTDGVVVARIDGAAGVNPVIFGAATAGNGIGFAGAANQQRFGRLTLGNAFGSELLDLPIPIEVQYYNSSGVYVTNTGDNCTAIALNNVYLSSGAATVGGTFASGKGSLKLTKPLVKTTVDLCVDLDGLVPTDATCVATAGNKTYLQWKWSGSTFDKDPVARATFGVFKSADEFIYLRENF